jgi:group I intron endonuclease
MNKISGIYGIKNTITGKFYVGSSVNVHVRWKTHASHLRRGVHHSVKLQNSWNKHGESAFIFGILEVIEAEELLMQAEQWYLDNWNTVDNGYNIRPTAGNAKGTKHTQEWKDNMSAIMAGNQYGVGVIASPERRAKMSAAMKGRKQTAEHRAKHSAAITGRKLTEEHKAKVSAAGKGRIKSQEEIEKIAASHRGKKRSPEARARISAGIKAAHEKRRLIKEAEKEAINTGIE